MPPPPPQPHRLLPRTAGFSLVEILVVIAVVGTLLALLFPMLAAARQRGKETVTISQLAQAATAFVGYTTNWKDAFPQPHSPSDPAYATQGRYFSLHATWPVSLGAELFGSAQAADSAATLPLRGYWPVLYPCAFIAVPDYWDPRTRAGESQLSSTRMADVRSPSHKAMVATAAIGGPGTQTLPLFIGFVDGSAARVRVSDVQAGVLSGDGNIPQAFHGGSSWIGSEVMHTLRGVAGRDVRSR